MNVLGFFIFTVVVVAKAPEFRDEPIKHVNVGEMKYLTCHTETPDAKVSWQFCASASGSYNGRCKEDEFSSFDTDPDTHYQLYFYQNYSNLLIYNVRLKHAGEYRMLKQDSKDVLRAVEGCQYLLVVHSSKADDKNSQTECKHGAGKDEQALERYANTTVYFDSIMSHMKRMPDEMVSQIAKDNTLIWGILTAILIIAVIHAFFSIAKFFIVIWSNWEKIMSFCKRRVSNKNEENNVKKPYISIAIENGEELEPDAGKGEFNQVAADNTSNEARTNWRRRA